MGDHIHDVIIVGAGMAGCAAAIVAARAGLDTLVLEQADTPGKLNLTGGRLYTHALRKLLPDFAATAPLQRRVVKERISILTNDAATSLDYLDAAAGDAAAASASWTVLRKSFDTWLVEEVKKAGATLLLSRRVNSLLTQDGAVTGVEAPPDTFRSHVVILADGASSLLGQKLGLVKKQDPADFATGAKEVIHLGEEAINARFNCSGAEGVTWLFLGYPSTGQMGGGFLYTNKDTLSLGMVLGMKDAREEKVSVLDMLAEFRKHPLIAPLIKDGEVVSRGGHMIPEGGYDALPELVGNGVLLAGDAAAMCLNLGYTVRGMDLAILSGMAAARTAIRAREAGRYSRDSLWSYHDELERENILPDMKLYRHLPHFLHNRRIFNTYPRLVNDFMRDIFTVDGTSEPAWKKVDHTVRQAGVMNILKDVWNGIKSF